jgi:ammonia channel protein AmtB
MQTYLYFSFLTSSFIFPVGLAWCWNDGWLQNMNFKDSGGASIVHILGGLSGFMGTFLLGPRIGRFTPDTKLTYILDDELLNAGPFRRKREESPDTVYSESEKDLTETTSFIRKKQKSVTTHSNPVTEIDKSLLQNVKRHQIRSSTQNSEYSSQISNHSKRGSSVEGNLACERKRGKKRT